MINHENPATFNEYREAYARMKAERDAMRAELESCRLDAERLDFMLQEQCIIRAENGASMPTVFSLWWVTLSEGQRYWHATERDAIDAAMQEQSE